MSVASSASGTQAATIGVEHDLFNPSPAVPGVYQLWVDLSAMADGDTLVLRLKRMVKSGGTVRTVYRQAFSNAQDADGGQVAVGIPLGISMTDNGAIRATLQQTTGTGRSYDYTVERIA